MFQESSYLLCCIAYLIRFISFFPLYSPCFKLILDVTFLHPASSVSFLYYYLNASSFFIFYLDLYCFSSSFFCQNYYNWRLPSAFLWFFSSYSFCFMNLFVHFFNGVQSEPFLITLESFLSSRLTRSHWTSYLPRPYCNSLRQARMKGRNWNRERELVSLLTIYSCTHGKDGFILGRFCANFLNLRRVVRCLLNNLRLFLIKVVVHIFDLLEYYISKFKSNDPKVYHNSQLNHQINKNR